MFRVTYPTTQTDLFLNRRDQITRKKKSKFLTFPLNNEFDSSALNS